MSGKEVRFYLEVADRIPDIPVPKCFYTLFDENSNREQIIMEDLSATHGCVAWPAQPTYEQARFIIDSLAKLHACCWDDSALLDQYRPHLDRDQLIDSFEIDNAALDRMIVSLGDRLSKSQVELFQKVFAAFPVTYWQRVRSMKNLTLCHGDAHAWNFLVPTQPADKVYLIDWQCWDIGVGMVDLAYFIGLWWPGDRRQQEEIPLLKYYHEQLLRYGVADYKWDDCWNDYRLMCLFNLYFPEVFYRKKFGEETMWNHLRRASQTIEDHACLDLLKSID
jgi:thiamine kinase-like enzyme